MQRVLLHLNEPIGQFWLAGQEVGSSSPLGQSAWPSQSQVRGMQLRGEEVHWNSVGRQVRADGLKRQFCSSVKLGQS